MRGDIVIIRFFGNEPRVRRIWSEDVRGVYVTTENHFHSLDVGKYGLVSVGFLWEDVFEYSQELIELTDKFRKDFAWGHLKPYRPTSVFEKAS